MPERPEIPEGPEKRKKRNSSFTSSLSFAERALGLCYLPVHVFILPVLLSIFSSLVAPGFSEKTLNAMYYGIGALYVLVLLHRPLRADFDELLDNKLVSALVLMSAYFLNALLSYAALIVMNLLLSDFAGTEAQLLSGLTDIDHSAIFGIAVFLVPLVEEPLFRGALFGTLCEKNRHLAYIVSILLFSLYHVWQYALAYKDVWILVYGIQYVPIGFVLARLYEKSRDIWLPVIFRMIVNAIGLAYYI